MDPITFIGATLGLALIMTGIMTGFVLLIMLYEWIKERL